jgi:hypothetical protein
MSSFVRCWTHRNPGLSGKINTSVFVMSAQLGLVAIAAFLLTRLFLR